MSGSYGGSSVVPPPAAQHVSRGYGTSATNDFAVLGNPDMSSPLSQSAHGGGVFHEDFDASQRGSSIIDGGIKRSSSRASTAVGGGGGEGGAVSRSNTLKKRSSVKRSRSLKRSTSKKSLGAGSIKGFGGVDSDSADFHNFSFTPVPTTGTPTEVLANRFQAWRQLLKSLIAYFREIQNSYDARGKALHKVQNTISSITHPAVFMSTDGLGEATRVLESYHKRSMAEANKAREIENDVIGALTGLRSDLGQKIKEIKSLSGDFKNSVDKEKDATRREVEKLRDAIQHADHEDGAHAKNDPYVVRLGVDRQIERQIDEENYLHRAYLNLESSGRELESIVVGEIQKAYNALAGILKREADDAYNAVESLRGGPIAMPKDQEWYQFVTHDPHFVDPSLPLRRVEEIEYPGKHHPSATEIRAGMLERKSKYLKSYTPGWYVLSPTHLHEFKSADKIYSQPPVMSLYLLDQKLGSHSERGSSSHKFMLKGKQSGGMHKGHNWVFRAETFDTMMAWFEDIRILTEKTGEERIAFVRKHARSVSGTSDRGTVSSDGMEEDEADQTPYSADVTSLAEQNPVKDERPRRPQPGGRFPSDLVLRKVGTTTADGGDDSSDDTNVIGAAGAIPGSSQQDYDAASPRDYGDKDPYRMEDVRTLNENPYLSQPVVAAQQQQQPEVAHPQPVTPVRQQQYPARNLEDSLGASQPPAAQQDPIQTQTYALPTSTDQPVNQRQSFLGSEPAKPAEASLARHPTQDYSNWLAPTAAGAAGVGAGALGAEAYRRDQQDTVVPETESKEPPGTHAATAGLPAVEEKSALTEPQSPPVEAAAFSRSLSTRASPLKNSSIDTRALGGDSIVPDALIAPAAASSPPSAANSPVRPTLSSPVAAPVLAGSAPLASSIGPFLSDPSAAPILADGASPSLSADKTAATPALSDAAAAPVLADNEPTFTGSVPVPAGPCSPGLGGNEREGAHTTGQFFPRVIRHDTNLSISKLHVPGEFPTAPR